MAKYKHLTLSERIEIYTMLKEGKSLRKIGKALNRDPTTIAKEIKKHLEVKETGLVGIPLISARSQTNVIRPEYAGQSIVWSFVINVPDVMISATNTKNRFARG